MMKKEHFSVAGMTTPSLDEPRHRLAVLRIILQKDPWWMPHSIPPSGPMLGVLRWVRTMRNSAFEHVPQMFY